MVTRYKKKNTWKEKTYDVLSIQRGNGNGTKYSEKVTFPKKQKLNKNKSMLYSVCTNDLQLRTCVQKVEGTLQKEKRVVTNHRVEGINNT